MAALALWCWRVAARDTRGVVAGAALLYATLLAVTTPSYPWYVMLLLALVPFQRAPVVVPALAITSASALLYVQWWWRGGATWATYLGYGLGISALAATAAWVAVAKRRDRHAPTPRPAGDRPRLMVRPPGPVASFGDQTTGNRASNTSPSLYDRFSREYAFCRERLFRDHTALIDAAVWPEGPRTGSRLLEIGCGPGIYARRLAARHAHIQTVGIDCSLAQVRLASDRASRERLTNCSFQHGDARHLPGHIGSADAVIASRLFTVLPDAEEALAEMHRVLRAGGRCFIAEPRSRLSSTLPLQLLRALGHLDTALRRTPTVYRDIPRASALHEAEFHALIASQPWATVSIWHDRRYSFALCTKATPAYDAVAAG
jgi:ubiquinone/menaquinone biosynthesis C-methylase UbiE